MKAIKDGNWKRAMYDGQKLYVKFDVQISVVYCINIIIVTKTSFGTRKMNTWRTVSENKQNELKLKPQA